MWLRPDSRSAQDSPHTLDRRFPDTTAVCRVTRGLRSGIASRDLRSVPQRGPETCAERIADTKEVEIAAD